MTAGLLRMSARQLRARARRAAVLGVGILVAATAFSLLTAATDTTEAQVRGTVQANFRTTYDLLVRPVGTQSQLEVDRGLVRNNFETGIFGGITREQWQQIKAIPGIEVAAPVAYLGWVNQNAGFEVRLGKYLRLDTPVRLRTLTSSQVGPPIGSPETFYWTVTKTPGLCSEVYVKSPTARSAFDPSDYGLCLTVGGNGLQNFGYVKSVAATTWGVNLYFPLLVAAVDPVEESRLVGLDKSLVSGQMLRENAPFVEGPDGPVLPVLASTRSFRTQTATLSVEDLKVPTGEAPARALVDSRGPGESGLDTSANWTKLRAMPSTQVGTFTFTAEELYSELRRSWTTPMRDISRYPAGISWAASPVSYTSNSDGSLSPVVVVNSPDATWRKQPSDSYEPFWISAPENSATQYRELSPQLYRGPENENRAPGSLNFSMVGEFDPELLPGFSDLARVPLETYRSPLVGAGDAVTAALLKGRPLEPTGNLGGYVAQPPLLLTTLAAASAMTDFKWFGTRADQPLPTARAPISVIRVRVAGVSGPDEVSVGRLKAAAALISQRTGLVVDITAGSSPQPQTIRLPAGSNGDPALTLSEGWTHKGVALLIVAALDRKSVVLFGLILLVTVSFLLNASLATVRARRAEIGTLATVGWSPGQVFRLVLGELAVIAVLAGVAGALLSVVLIMVGDLKLSLTRVLLIPPVALGVALVAGAIPAFQASRITPIAALTPPVADSAARSRRRVRSVFGYARAGLGRRPGRTALAAVTLGLAVACLTGLLTATFAFRGVVAGSLLGNYVTVQIRGVDYASTALAVGLAAFSVADLLALTIRERATEIVTLKATGWANTHLTQATLLEATGIAALGALPGAGIALAAAITLGAPTGTSLTAATVAFTTSALVVLIFATFAARIATHTTIATTLATD